MEIKTSKGVYCVNADYTIEEKQGEYPKLTCTIPATKNKTWIDDCKELDRLYTPGEQDEFVIINPVKITKGDSYDLEITAVGAFEFDFVKSRIDDNLPTHSYAVEYLLDLVFKDTRYSYDLQGTYEKREFTNFGSDNRYKLFLQIMNRFNLEFKIIGKIVRINSKIGNDTGFQFRYLKNIKDTKYSVDATNLVTHVKGYGAYHDANDQSKGRLEVEYLSPLSDIYGKLSGEPVVDERMSISATLLEKCKQSVESSVAVTVSTTLVALKNQEYRGVARIGDSIWFIDERIELEKKIRFSTVKSYYDAFDELIKQDVQLGDKDVFSRAQSSDSASHSKLIDMQKELSDQLADVEDAIKKTYVMPSGVNRVFYSSDLPEDVPKGTIKEGDTLFRNIDGETKMYRWDGVQWELVPVVNDVEKFREELNNEIAQVNQSMQAQSEEHDRQVADILSKTHSVESLANQAKSDVASAIARANQVKTEAIADARAQVATVSQALNTAKSELQSAIASADQKARDSQASATALRNDLNLQTSKILAQAQAQTDLTNRVSTVETLADGTRSTVAELSKTLSKATGDITSVTSRTKSVEDTLSQTRTQYEALTQTVNTQIGQIESISRRTGTIEAGLTGIQERFESIKIGNRNYFKNAKDRSYLITNAVTQDFRTYIYEDFWKNTLRFERKKVRVSFDIAFSPALPQNFTTRVHFAATPWYSSSVTFKGNTTDVQHIDLIIDLSSSNASYWADNVFIRFSNSFPVNTNVSIKNMMLYISDFREDYAEPSEDFRSEFATYVRNATENSAELVRRIETADGKAVDAKAYAQQTAEGFKSRIENLETYKDGEGTRASQYFTASRDETARQVTALRTAVTDGYVAKSVFEETARGISQRFESLYVGGTNLLTGTDEYTEIFNSEQSHAEFLQTPYDLAPVFDKYGLIEYTLSFDLRASQAGQVVVYQQNGSGSKYSGLWKPLTVTTEWQRFHVTFTPTEGTMSLANSYLAFYGTYGTGVKPIIRRAKIERGTIATDWSPSPEDATNYADTKIAEYKHTVDGQFVNLQTQVNGKANLTDFQRVQTTSQLYERIIGSTEGVVKEKVARMVMADSLFLTEVKDKISGTETQVSQLAGSWAVKNLTSSGTVLNQLNLNKDGSVKIDGKLVQITGTTYIQDGVITSAKIAGLDAGKIKTGTLDAARIRANSIDGSKIVFDQAFLNKMTANEALFKQLFAQSAFITSVQAVAVSAKQIAGGIAKALNGGMDVNFDESKINFYTNVAAIRRIYTGHPTQFIKFETEGNYSRTIIGSNRNGGEVFNSATFAGIVVENTNNINTEDNVRLYGDNTLFRHAQGDVGWNINSVTQRIVPANINAESEIWSKHFVAPDKNSKPVRLDTAVAALWDIWNHIIYNNFEFNEALRTHIKARRDNWKFELNL